MPVVQHNRVRYNENQPFSRGSVINYFTPIQKDILFYVDVDTTLPMNVSLELGSSVPSSVIIRGKYPSTKDAVLCHMEAFTDSDNPNIMRCYYIVPPKLQHLYNSELIETPQPHYDNLEEIEEYYTVERTTMRLRTGESTTPVLYAPDVKYPSAMFVKAEERRFDNREFDNLFVRETHLYKTLPGPIISNALSPQSYSEEDSFKDENGKTIIKTGFVYSRETRAQVVPHMPGVFFPKDGIFTAGFEKTEIPAVEIYTHTLPYQVNLRNKIRSKDLRLDVDKCNIPEMFSMGAETETVDTAENFNPVDAELKTPEEIELENATYLADSDAFSIQTGKDEFENRSALTKRITKTKKKHTTHLNGRTQSQVSGKVLNTRTILVKADGSQDLDALIKSYEKDFFVEARPHGCYIILELVEKDTNQVRKYFEQDNGRFPAILKGIIFITQDDGRSGSFVAMGKPQSKVCYPNLQESYSGPCTINIEERWVPIDAPCPFLDEELKFTPMKAEQVAVSCVEYNFNVGEPVLHDALLFSSGFTVGGGVAFPATNTISWQPYKHMTSTRFAGGRLYTLRTTHPPKD